MNAHASGTSSTPEPVVLYEERDDIAIITLNRPEKKNTLTDAVIQGIADGIDTATARPDEADGPPRCWREGAHR